MSVLPSSTDPEFDEFAEDYNEALEKGIGVSGENAEFFARGRVDWLSRCLAEISFQPCHVLDFGCGIGTATPFLLGLPGLQTVCGVDVSARSLAVARSRHGSDRVTFQIREAMTEESTKDLAFANGVFHHIPPGDRAGAVGFIWRALRPGGLFALWENNPWNPGTRYVMSRIPFDRDARTLSAPETNRLLRSNGFEVIRTDFLFVFPRPLTWCRPLEPMLSRLPLGAQYQVLGRRVT